MGSLRGDWNINPVNIPGERRWRSACRVECEEGIRTLYLMDTRAHARAHTCGVSALERNVALWESHPEGTGGWGESEGTPFKPYSVLQNLIPQTITTFCAQTFSGIAALVFLLRGDEEGGEAHRPSSSAKPALMHMLLPHLHFFMHFYHFTQIFIFFSFFPRLLTALFSFYTFFLQSFIYYHI